jgi:glycosyltransferase involved in cell wall biosynthesis
MPETGPERIDFGALLPGVGVFGGVRRFLEVGNALVRRGHRYTLYHPEGTRPDWLPFAGEVRRLVELPSTAHTVLLCGEPTLVPQFEAAPARLKLFYCVLEKMPNERSIVTRRDWIPIANSTGIRERLRKRYGVEAQDAIGGLDPALFRPTGPPRPLQPEPLRILAYGRLSRARKGTALVVRAAARVARQLGHRAPAWAGTLAHPVQLVLFDHVGPGNERDPRPDFESPIPVEFHLNLSQAELAALYSTCDVFVSAERRAGWNNTVAEAMACGVPVVCTASGTRDLAIHGETAWVVRWRHPWALARGIRALARDRKTRERMRSAARTRALGFTWDRVAERIETIVRDDLTRS